MPKESLSWELHVYLKYLMRSFSHELQKLCTIMEHSLFFITALISSICHEAWLKWKQYKGLQAPAIIIIITLSFSLICKQLAYSYSYVHLSMCECIYITNTHIIHLLLISKLAELFPLFFIHIQKIFRFASI